MQGISSLNKKQQDFINNELEGFLNKMEDILYANDKNAFDEKQRTALLNSVANSILYGVNIGVIAANLKES